MLKWVLPANTYLEWSKCPAYFTSEIHVDIWKSQPLNVSEFWVCAAHGVFLNSEFDKMNFRQRFCNDWKVRRNNKTHCWLTFIVIFLKFHVALQACLIRIQMATHGSYVTNSSSMSWWFVSLICYSTALHRTSRRHRLFPVRPEGTCCPVWCHLYLLDALMFHSRLCFLG